MIRRSHDRWRCPKCRFTGLFPPTVAGKPQFWCPMCSISGKDVAMVKVASLPKAAKPAL